MGWTFYRPDVDPTMGTSLPSNPVDGQEFVLVDSTTAPTYAWKLRYVSAKASNKWVFIGGSPKNAIIDTAETTASTAYTALATAGPSIAVPVAGDYFVETGFAIESSTTGAVLYFSYDIGATGAADADAVRQASGGSGWAGPASMRRKQKSGLTAVTLTAKYRVSGGTQGFGTRWMSLVPIAIGG